LQHKNANYNLNGKNHWANKCKAKKSRFKKNGILSVDDFLFLLFDE
jgi:hypothetical protein